MGSPRAENPCSQKLCEIPPPPPPPPPKKKKKKEEKKEEKRSINLRSAVNTFVRRVLVNKYHRIAGERSAGSQRRRGQVRDWCYIVVSLSAVCASVSVSTRGRPDEETIPPTLTGSEGSAIGLETA